MAEVSTRPKIILKNRLRASINEVSETREDKVIFFVIITEAISQRKNIKGILVF